MGKKLKTGARKTDPMNYSVHLIWARKMVGNKVEDLWIPLANYRHLQNAYRRVEKMRKHINAQRQSHKVLNGKPIFVIENRKTKNCYLFHLVPDYKLDIGRTARKQGIIHIPRVCPSTWILMPSEKMKKKRKKKMQQFERPF